jgi:hypothetical protein
MLTNIGKYYSHWMLAGIFLLSPFFMADVRGEYIPKGDETAGVNVRIGGDRGYYRSYRKPYYRGYYDKDRRYRDRRYRHYDRYDRYDRHDRYDRYDRRGDAGFQFRIN